MEQQKSFWRKYEILIIAVITILIIYLIVVFNQKINFLLGNELIVNLNPHQNSLSMHYGDVSNAEFNISIENAAYCKASCSYSFSDKSSNKVLDNGNFEIEKGQTATKNYNLSVKRLGSGQDIYSFDVQCRSIKSFFCLTHGPETPRSSLVIVNYDLTETEKELKKILKQNVTKLLELLSEADVLHQQANQKYFELGFKVNLRNLSNEKIGIDDIYDKTRVSIENLRSLWAVENYIRLSQLFNSSFFVTIHEIKNSLNDFDKSINDTVSLHNELLSGFGKLSIKLKELGNFVQILNHDNLTGSMGATIKDFNMLASSLTNNTFDDYKSLIAGLGNVVEQQTQVINKSKIPAASLFFNSEYFLNFKNDFLCSLRKDCNKNISIDVPLKNTEQFIEEYPNQNFLKRNCDSLIDLKQKYSDIRNETLGFIAENNIIFPLDTSFIESADNFMDNEIRKINNSYYESFEKIISENRTDDDVVGIVYSILPKNATSIISINYNESINFSLYLLSAINISDETSKLIGKCAKLGNYTEKIGSFNFEPVAANLTYKIISKIETNLSDNPPICCVFNECKPCCRDESCSGDPKTFPIIFLHGHSFAKDNSPEFSLDAFNKLQSKLEDDGYLNAGIVSLYSQNEQLPQGVWGLSGKPVTVKASYYYDAFRQREKYIVVPTKSESIDTYALRLKDLIGIVKQRTNKPKVNIVAHSMGGLVARRYIQIFGEEGIDKLIMIATPNKGISNEIGNYCRLVGENRECQDMRENSLFINKVNDPLKQPHGIRLYAIVGNGCKMGNGYGDGVVLSENAELENAKAYFVNGTCGGIFGENLHTGILDIEKYNETYKIVAEILK